MTFIRTNDSKKNEIELKKILYYVSDHGFGHASRTVAIVRELKKYDFHLTIRNSNAQSFLKNSLLGIKIVSGITDVGTVVKNDGLTIDKENSKAKISKWVNAINDIAINEVENLNETPDLIISDISAMPFLVAKKLKIPSIAISNFSWYDAHYFLVKEERDILKDIYDNADLAIQLPLGTKMDHFQNKKNVGFVSRIATSSKNKIKKELGINEEFLILYAMGESNIPIVCDNADNVRAISLHSKVNANNEVIDLSSYTEGQNLVKAADFVICKSGYGILSECLTNGTPFNYISDNKRPELREITTHLKKMGIDNQMEFENLKHLKINKEFFESANKFEQISNDNKNIINIIREYVQ